MAKKKVKKKSTPESDLSFEDSLSELEMIVADLEGGELGLGDALARYEQGIAHLKQCHAQLQQATRRIELLSGVDAAGNPITEPFDDEQHETLEAKKQARTKRRGGVDDGGTLF